MAKGKQKAKAGKAPKKHGGPFLAAAVFCEGILEDMQGMLSVQRIVDGMLVSIPSSVPADFPSKKNPIQLVQNILLIFRSGDKPGKHKLKLDIESPAGKKSKALQQEVELTQPPNGGLNFKTKTNLHIYSSGVFWVDVRLDGKLVTRMPFDVQIKREEPTPPAK
jgi:hypothetical protein